MCQLYRTSLLIGFSHLQSTCKGEHEIPLTQELTSFLDSFPARGKVRVQEPGTGHSHMCYKSCSNLGAPIGRTLKAV